MQKDAPFERKINVEILEVPEISNMGKRADRYISGKTESAKTLGLTKAIKVFYQLRAMIEGVEFTYSW